MATVAVLGAVLTIIDKRAGYYVCGFLDGGFIFTENYAPGSLALPILPFIVGSVLGAVIIGLLGEWAMIVCDGVSWRSLAGSTGGHAAVTLDADAAVLLDLTGQELGLDTQNANTILAGPTTAPANEPTVRALVAADVGTGTPDGTKYLRDDMRWQAVSSHAVVTLDADGGITGFDRTRVGA